MGELPCCPKNSPTRLRHFTNVEIQETGDGDLDDSTG